LADFKQEQLFNTVSVKMVHYHAHKSWSMTHSQYVL